MPDLFDPDPDYDAKPVAELTALVDDATKPLSARFAAATAIGRRSKEQHDLVPVLQRIATSPELRQERMMRLVSLAYIGVASLVYCGTPEALAAARAAKAGFSQSDQDSLDFFRKSGGLSLPETG